MIKMAIHLPLAVKAKLYALRAKGSTASERIRSLLKSKSGRPRGRDGK